MLDTCNVVLEYFIILLISILSERKSRSYSLLTKVFTRTVTTECNIHLKILKYVNTRYITKLSIVVTSTTISHKPTT